MDKPFAPTGITRFVGATATQIGSLGEAGASLRVLNLSSSNQSFTFGPTNAVAAQTSPASNGATAAQTITMLPNSVETFAVLGDWMIASSSTGFQVTRGDGV